ncbi:hypothetical protein NDU88_001373 [Pleurodeles waltl]|uniref:Uncharacterized protein n=1 Tax=Pleurodeles waltl TaxID=8319 RepID=A0AAV7NFK2_PLEWA|nr:hypothetical protein NDU88_001373 [Pleurodeles waltl]
MSRVTRRRRLRSLARSARKKLGKPRAPNGLLCALQYKQKPGGAALLRAEEPALSLPLELAPEVGVE